jgi:hypothetical protein
MVPGECNITPNPKQIAPFEQRKATQSKAAQSNQSDATQCDKREFSPKSEMIFSFQASAQSS